MRNVWILAKGVIKELLRRQDFYLIFALLLVIISYSATISFGGETGFMRYFKEIGISLVYIFSVVIAVTFAGRQLSQEIEAKTIYPILAHPVSRGQFIAGKFLGVLIIAAISFTLYYGAFIISILMRKDFSTPWPLYVEGYILQLCMLSFFIALAILLSLFLSAAANIGITLILYFAFTWFGASIPGYIFLPHPELFDIKEKIIHSWDVVPVWAMSFLVSYAAIYTAIFLCLGYLAFKDRNL
jgi:Cu-processing system permease protein